MIDFENTMRYLLTAILCAPVLSAQVPDSLIHDADVEYSNVGARVAMDIVRPKTASSERRPAVLLVHGGGFRAGNRQSYLPVAIRLAQRGYVAATASYRLAPRTNSLPPLKM